MALDTFSDVRAEAIRAAVVGLIESIIWIGASIVSILAYCCVIPLHKLVSYGSITELVFFEIYFRGDCQPTDYPAVDFTILKSVKTVFDSEDILIWTCVYMAVCVVWLGCSCLLFSHVRKSDLKVTSLVLYAWAVVAIAITCMDISIGIIFAIDYSRFQWEAYQYNLLSFQAGAIDPEAVQLISGKIAAISMMIISFKGFLGLFANIYIIYRLIVAATIVQNVDNADSTRSILSTRPQIRAFDIKEEVSFENAGFVVESRPKPVELNEESINRAARMSTDNLQERRFRSIDNFQQYPPPRQAQSPPQQSSVNSPQFPVPDYTPPMPRANQNGQLRNTRYQ